MYDRIADRDRSCPQSSSAVGDHLTLPEVHRKWVGADNSPVLFRENDTNGSALRSVDDVRAHLGIMRGSASRLRRAGTTRHRLSRPSYPASQRRAVGHQEGYRKAVDGPQVFLHSTSAAGPQHRVGLPRARADVV